MSGTDSSPPHGAQRTSTRSVRRAEFCATLYCYLVCLGLLDAQERADLFDAATAAMRQRAQAGHTSARELMRSVHGVMRNTMSARDPRRWDFRRALTLLIDVPMHAMMTALPIFTVVWVIGIASGHPIIGGVAAALVGILVLISRSLYVVQREIRLAHHPSLMPEQTRIVTVANFVTVIRLLPFGVLIPILAWDHQNLAAMIVYLSVVVADSLDGYIARRFEQRTKLGVLLDPLVDRLVIILSVGGLLFSSTQVPAPIRVGLILLMIRETLVVVLGLAFYVGNASPKPNRAGFIASTLAMVGVGTCYVGVALDVLDNAWVVALAVAVLVASIVAGAISFFHYQRSVTAGAVFARGELFTDPLPESAISRALSRFTLPADRALVEPLVELIALSTDADPSAHRLVRDELAKVETDIQRAKAEVNFHRVGQLEERRRTLVALVKRLS